MSKGLRLSEKWFNRGLWIVAVVFAWFLIGLGNTIIRDLPKVEKHYSLEDFIDQQAARPIRADIQSLKTKQKEVNGALDQANLKLDTHRNDYHAARTTYSNWLSTRNATDLTSQDDLVIQRTQKLDALKQLEHKALKAVEQLKQARLDNRQALSKQQTQLNKLENTAREKLTTARKKQQLRAFLYRLALTLPLLVVSAWLFKKKRKTPYWPFVWGFIFFSAFAFFVELVPYLPSYGGYVRYIVGIVLTFVIGRQAIIALNRYLEKQRQIESMPNVERKETLSYDLALARLAKGVCPGCERQVDLKDTENDFCPHCGIGLHDYCESCEARKSAFAKFCHKCGATA